MPPSWPTSDRRDSSAACSPARSPGGASFRWPGPEIGWGIAADHWSRGYATEAAEAAAEWAFGVLGWKEIVHAIDPANAASIAVAKKLGSTRRGPGRLPAPFDEVRIDLWGQTRADWLSQRSAAGNGSSIVP